jgi:hypothetical protein
VRARAAHARDASAGPHHIARPLVAVPLACTSPRPAAAPTRALSVSACPRQVYIICIIMLLGLATVVYKMVSTKKT